METLTLISGERYRASASERRAHGGSTVTLFFVHRNGQADYGHGVAGFTRGMVPGYGASPGARKTDAAARYARLRGVESYKIGK